MANCVFTFVFTAFAVGIKHKERLNMKWLCSVGVAVSLAMQPALAEKPVLAITRHSKRVRRVRHRLPQENDRSMKNWSVTSDQRRP